jgi:prepilin-type N-terminal cleavage/methylation domain-containing protein
MTISHWQPRLARRLDCDGRDTSDAGFTLIESIVSFVIFAIVAASASTAIVHAMRSAHETQQRVDAAQVAQYFISDAIRRANTIPPTEGRTVITNVGGAGTTDTRHAEPEQFTVIETVRFDAGSCISGRLFTVNVEVRQAQTNVFLARSDARVACPRV